MQICWQAETVYRSGNHATWWTREKLRSNSQQKLDTRVGTLIVATIYLQLIQN